VVFVDKKLGGSDLLFSFLATGSYLTRYAVNHYFAKNEKQTSFIPRIQASLLIMGVGTLICALTSNVYYALIGVWVMAGQHYLLSNCYFYVQILQRLYF
jgi:hypothetical protein